MTFVLLRILGAMTPLRGSENEEAVGMDIVHHGEEAYASGEGAVLIRDAGMEEELVSEPR